MLTNPLSLHAASCTPEWFRAAPGPMARTAVFARGHRARPTRSLTGDIFDAAEFTSLVVTACSFASPRSAAGVSSDDCGWLSGSPGGLPEWDSHPPLDSPLQGATVRHPSVIGRALSVLMSQASSMRGSCATGKVGQIAVTTPRAKKMRRIALSALAVTVASAGTFIGGVIAKDIPAEVSGAVVEGVAICVGGEAAAEWRREAVKFCKGKVSPGVGVSD